MPPFQVPSPPLRPDGPPLWATAAVPVVGSLGTLALVVSGGHRQMIIGLVLTAATLGALSLQTIATASSRRAQLRVARERYRRDLETARLQLLDADPGDPGLMVAVGTRTRRIEYEVAEDDPRGDPVCRAARDRFVAAYTDLPQAQHLIDLASTPLLEAERAHARAILLESAQRHPPDRLHIEVLSSDPDGWSWVALLPHATGSAGHRVVVVDGTEPPAHTPSTTIIKVSSAPAVDYTATVCGPAEAAVRARRIGSMRVARPRPSRRWTVALGTSDEGPLYLDLREAAEGGVGPHGLLVGATGSGKSQLLRQMLGELVATHHSDELRLALIDFKGGATFSVFKDVPHVAAYVTNLADPGATRRLHQALEGELMRRQRDLAAAGAASIREHPMARLLIVIDEFAELLTEDPALGDLFTRIGRLGRSLGVHLLLSTQRLEEGRLHGLEAHLSYRIALRTFTAAESRLAIGSPAAAELPQHPGAGLLAAAGELRRFQSPAPDTPVRRSDRIEVVSLRPHPREVLTVLEDRVRSSTGPPAPPLWLPPLDLPPTLGDLPPDARMHASVGVIDLPGEQRIGTLTLDLTGGAGHVAVVGAPRSGKSTTLGTIAAALRRSTPDVRMLGLDLTGGLHGVLPPERLASARTPERVDRLLRHLRRTAEGNASPPVVVLIDSWSAMRDEYAWQEALHQIGERGLAADVHLVVAALRWSDLRPAVRDLFGSRLELRLGDPLDSEIDRRLAATVPAKPGHGLIAPGYAIQLAIDSKT